MKTQLQKSQLSKQKISLVQQFKIALAYLFFLATITSNAQGSLFTNYFAFGNSGGNYASSIAVDSNGNSFICGKYNGVIDFDPSANVLELSSVNQKTYIAKYNSLGVFQWVKSFDDSPFPSELIVDSQGNLIMTGSFQNTVDFDPSSSIFNLTTVAADIYVLKLNNNGEFIWVKQMGGTSGDTGKAITTDASNNIYITGSFRNTADFDPGIGVFTIDGDSSSNIYICKITADGNFVFAKAISRTPALGASVSCSDIKVDTSGNIFVVGGFSGTVDFDPSSGIANATSFDIKTDAFILKLNGSGNYLWSKTFSSNQRDGINDIVINSNGELFCALECDYAATIDLNPGAGIFNVTGVEVFASIVKLDGNGDFLFGKKIEATDAAYCASLALDSNQNLLVTGRFSGIINFGTLANPVILNEPVNLDNLYFLHLSSVGDFLSLKNIKGSGDMYEGKVVIDATDAFHFATAFNLNLTIGLIGGVATTQTFSDTGSILMIKDQLTTLSNPNFKQTATINVYPNPTNNILNIAISENATLQIIDLLGKTVLEKSITSGNNTITIEALPTGMYISKIQNENGTYNQKIMKL